MIYFSGGCVIGFAERLRDFFVERLHNCVKRLRDFACEEVV